MKNMKPNSTNYGVMVLIALLLAQFFTISLPILQPSITPIFYEEENLGINQDPLIVKYRDVPIKASNEPFLSRWDTTKGTGGGPARRQVVLPLEASGTYDFIINWGDGSIQHLDNNNYTSYSTHEYSAEGEYDISITGTIIGWQFNDNPDIAPKLISISQWGCLGLGNSGSYFYGCENLILTAQDQPCLTGTTTLYRAFKDCIKLGAIGDMRGWDTSNITNMQEMFDGATNFNQNISSWDTSNVTTMQNMFASAMAFNQSIGDWNVAKVVNMNRMFQDANNFNQNIGKWETSSVINIDSMFLSASAFNQPLEEWNVSNVTSMYLMFSGATSFNQDISQWNVAKVTNMDSMFFGASAFNQPIGGWDVSNVTTMYGMFMSATTFNQDISQWNVSKVTTMGQMFQSANAFNQNISIWNVSQVTYMYQMFMNALSFNQALGIWNISKVTNMQRMFQGVTLSTPNYDNLLINWALLTVQPDNLFHGGNSKYSSNAISARDLLNNTRGWDIIDGGMRTITLEIISPTNSLLLGISAPAFEIVSSNVNTHTLWYTLDDGLFNQTCSTFGTINQTTWNKFGSESVTIKFYANDTIGNITSAVVSVLKDNHAPQMNILSPELNEYINQTAPEFEIIITDDNIHTMWYTIDSAQTKYEFIDNGTIDAGHWESLTNNANHILRFYANDTAGNLGYAEVTVRKMVIPNAPVLLKISSPSISGSVELSWTAVPYATYYKIYRSTTEINLIGGRQPIEEVTSTSYNDSGLTNGTFYYVIVACNSVGDSLISNCESVVIAIPPQDTNQLGEDEDGIKIEFIYYLLGSLSGGMGLLYYLHKIVVDRKKEKNTKKPEKVMDSSWVKEIKDSNDNGWD
jgi:surface protein